MSRSLRQIGLVSSLTVVSRVLGLARDVLLVTVLGVNAWTSAFLLAFTLPNLARRLLGEGALTSAFVPTYVQAGGAHGQAKAEEVLNGTLTWLGSAMLAMLVLGSLVVAAALAGGWLPARWEDGFALTLVLAPYALPVCLAAILAAALQVRGHFFLGAASSIWLNLLLIVAIVLPALLGATLWWQLGSLCAAVLLAGVVQVLLPGGQLCRQGWRPRLAWVRTAELEALRARFLPAVLAAAVFQLNTAISRFFAYGADETGLTIYYLANRLVELPLGVFAVAVVTVAFPALSRHAATADAHQGTAELARGLRLILAVTVPAAVGLVLLREPVVAVLFGWGAFAATDVAATAAPLWVLASGMPLYGAVTLLTRAWHAYGEMRRPLIFACANLVLNTMLSALLIGPLGVTGLALANVLAMAVHTLLLLVMLPGYDRRTLARMVLGPLGLVVIAAAVMGLLVLALRFGVTTATAGWRPVLTDAVTLAVAIPAGAALYGLLLWWGRFPDREELRSLGRKL